MILIVLGREWIFWPFPCVGRCGNYLFLYHPSTETRLLPRLCSMHPVHTRVGWRQPGVKLISLPQPHREEEKEAPCPYNPAGVVPTPLYSWKPLPDKTAQWCHYTMMGKGRGHLSSHRTTSPHVNLSSASSPSGIYEHFDGFNDDESPTSSRPRSLNSSV